jgi:hypothetical protein
MPTSTEPRLELRTDSTLPLDECLVGVVAVQAGSQAGRVSAQLNLIEGDLTITVTGAAGYTARCAWPWPVDAQGRVVDLAPGSRLVGAVPLIGTDTSAPLFPSPGEYTLVAEFDVAPGVRLTSPAVAVRRTPEQDRARAAALRNHDVIQSLLSASLLGNAAAGLHAVAEGSRPTTRVLAALALDHPDAVVAAATSDQAQADVAAAIAAVLPAGVADADPRRVDLLARLGGGGVPQW